MHDIPLITTLVAGFGLAFIFGSVAQRLRLSPLVGYLLAGVAIGPATPGYVADQALAPELAEIGVILLMFGVGLHFSLRDLLSVRAIAIPGRVAQIALATYSAWRLPGRSAGRSAAGVVFGLALSVASTVVLLRALQERHLLETERGRIAVGWLIVEDLAMVLTLVLLPAIAGALRGRRTACSGGARCWCRSALTLAQGGGLRRADAGRRPAGDPLGAAPGRRRAARASSSPWRCWRWRSASPSVRPSSSGCHSRSAPSSPAWCWRSPSSATAPREDSLPLRDAFAVLFFVSVGMLFDPSILVRMPLAVVATLAVIVLGKSVAAYAIVRIFGYSRATALTVSASLAQIGEFSFILATLGARASGSCRPRRRT